MEHKKATNSSQLKSGSRTKLGNKKKKQKQKFKKKLNTRKELRKQQRKQKKSKKHEFILTKTHASENNRTTQNTKKLKPKHQPVPKKSPTGSIEKKIPILKRKPRQSRTLTIKTVEDKIKEEQKALEDAKIARLEQKYFGGRYSSSEEESSDEHEQEDLNSDADGDQASSDISESETWNKNLTMDQLKEKMAQTRRKRLLEENEEEDKYIQSLSKKLKLNKKAIIPESFRTDGLDYLLEVCEPKLRKGDDKPSDETETSAYLKEKRLKKLQQLTEKGDKLSESDMEEDEEHESSDFDDMDFSDEPDASGGEDLDDEEEADQDDEADTNQEDDSRSSDEADLEIHEGDDQDSSEEEDMKPIGSQKGGSKSKAKLKHLRDADGNECWEDIYGRLRDQDGNVITKASGPAATEKYIPPGKREESKASSRSLSAIEKNLKGLLNRLAEANMHSISTQVEQLYMTNSRNEMNECLLDLICSALVRTVLTPERVALEHVMLIAILHANVGTEVGAFFIQSFVQKFDGLYKTTIAKIKNTSEGEVEASKELENLMLLICYMFHFKIVDSSLIYDLLHLIGETFLGKDVEIILTVLRSIGFRLRKDNPIRLKEFILLIQGKASETKLSQTSSRVKFMLDILLAIRNNNMTKIPNYDPSYGEHLSKIIKTHLHKGTYISELKISLQDLLNADAKGRWWIVGSAWSNTKDSMRKPSETVGASQTPGVVVNEKLLAKAKALGMSTEVRKNIFCILMTAEDYVDCFEKLMHLGLKNQVEREIMHVIIYCCLQEKTFNPYYGLLLTKLSTVERRILLTIQCTIWDRLRDLNILPKVQLKNLTELLVQLINGKVLPITVLKIIDFTDMDEVKLEFLRNTLAGILLQDRPENLQEIFTKLGSSNKFSLFRESLKLFLLHFMLKSKDNVACVTKMPNFGPDKIELLTTRVSLVDRIMTTMGQGKVQF